MNPELKIGAHSLVWGRQTYLMGILNITPDSFSGDGLLNQEKLSQHTLVNSVLFQAKEFVDSGAHILDVGGESTRPGALPVSENEEMDRVLPVIKLLAQEFDVMISVDTYRSQVALAALESGAHMVNDVWGLRADPDLAGIIAQKKVPVILMHNRSSWAHAEIKQRLGGRYVGIPYENLLEDVKRELQESVQLARQAGIPDEHIILDPGIGFGKSVEQNLELIDRLGEIRDMGFPVLLGPSRKSFIGFTLDLPPDQRLEGTAAAVAIGIAHGADIVRVHDVSFISRVVRMSDAITRRR